MIYEICKYGNPVLRKVAKAIDKIDDEIHALAQEMLGTMRHAQGVGLAAQQINLTKAICVIQIPVEYDQDEEGVRLNPEVQMPLVLINPVIKAFSSEKVLGEEGCLSFPGITAPIKRSTEIELSYADLDGQEHHYCVRQFLARVIQHEVDHLNGVLFIDHLSQVKKISLSGQLKRMRKETKLELGI